MLNKTQKDSTFSIPLRLRSNGGFLLQGQRTCTEEREGSRRMAKDELSATRSSPGHVILKEETTVAIRCPRTSTIAQDAVNQTVLDSTERTGWYWQQHHSK